MEVKCFSKRGDKLSSLTFKEWADDQAFYIHECNYNVKAKEKIAAEIYYNFSTEACPQECTTLFNDIVKVYRVRSHVPSVEFYVNGEEIYPKYMPR